MMTGVSTVSAPRLIELVNKYGYDLELNDYPIFDETYRDVLNKLIIDHFWLREIAAETPTLFIFYLNRKMREEMPGINPVFEALRLDQWHTDDHTSEGNTTSDMTADDTPNNKTVSTQKQGTLYSDTPQAQLYANVGEDYATNLTDITATNTTEQTGTNRQTTNNLTDYVTRTYGRSGQLPIDMVERFVSGYNNANKLVFAVLEPCFSQLWRDHENGL